MKSTVLIIILFLTLDLSGQKSEIENLINQISNDEVPKSFEYYYLVPESLKEKMTYDSIQNYQILELRRVDKAFPLDLIYEENNEKTNWKKYDLAKVKFVAEDDLYQISPPLSKNVKFVKYHNGEKEYDSLLTMREPNTFLVKKKWIWNKNSIWKNKKFNAELKKARKRDAHSHPEEKVYFQFSKPIFSEDKKHARMSIFKRKRCKGDGFAALYRNNKGNWEKLLEYNQVTSITRSSHGRCKDISILHYQ